MKKIFHTGVTTYLSLGVIVLVLYFLYPEISSRISRPLDVRSTLSAHGYYYPLNMHQLTALSVDSNTVTLTGYDVQFYQRSEDRRIQRSFPEKYTVRDTCWMLLDSTLSENGRTIRTFRHAVSLKELSVSLPFWNSIPEWTAMRSNANETLIILSGADWKHGEDVYLGFIEIKN